MKFPNFFKLGKTRSFFLFSSSILVLSTFFFFATAFKQAETPPKPVADWIRCSKLGMSLSSYISSISDLDLCGLCIAEETTISFTVSYYVNQYSEVDMEDIENQIMFAITHNSKKPCEGISLDSRSAISCTQGNHYLYITLKYGGYCEE